MIRTMNVPADNAVGFVVARGRKHRSIAKVSQELDGLAGGLTEIVGKRTPLVVSLFALPIVPVMDPLGARVCVAIRFSAAADSD